MVGSLSPYDAVPLCVRRFIDNIESIKYYLWYYAHKHVSFEYRGKGSPQGKIAGKIARKSPNTRKPEQEEQGSCLVSSPEADPPRPRRGVVAEGLGTRLDRAAVFTPPYPAK